jgi:serine/threonine protein kinase
LIRDIYPKNVLVQSVRLASDEEPEFDCLLSDLGEGKNLSNSAESREYMAPNLASSSLGTKADDIYAWGRLGVEVISVYSPLLRNPDGELYPAALMRVLERCLDPNPEGRFDAKSLVVVMDEVVDGPGGLAANAYGEEMEWYDGGYELPQLRRKLESSLELREHWLTLSSEKTTMDDDLMD